MFWKTNDLLEELCQTLTCWLAEYVNNLWFRWWNSRKEFLVDWSLHVKDELSLCVNDLCKGVDNRTAFNTLISRLKNITAMTLSFMILPFCLPSVHFSLPVLRFQVALQNSVLGNDQVDIFYRVDIFYQVPNPSIWMYYLPDPSTNWVSFVYM